MKKSKNLNPSFLLLMKSIIVKRILICSVLFLVFANLSYGQLSIVNSDMSMAESGSLQVTGICHVTISDTLNCSSVQIVLSDDLNDTILLNHEFQYDQVTGLPPGMSWSRISNDIQISLGTFQANTIWRARIRLKSNSNSWTSWNEFVLN